jgi:hypothetical protein
MRSQFKVGSVANTHAVLGRARQACEWGRGELPESLGAKPIAGAVFRRARLMPSGPIFAKVGTVAILGGQCSGGRHPQVGFAVTSKAKTDRREARVTTNLGDILGSLVSSIC